MGGPLTGQREQHHRRTGSENPPPKARAELESRDPQADKNNLRRAFLKRDFTTESPNPATRRPTRPTPGVRGSHRPRKEFGRAQTEPAPVQQRATRGARKTTSRPPRRAPSPPPPPPPTQPSPRASRPARTGEPIYRTTRSRDRSGSRSGSRDRKPPSDREAQTTKGRP